MLRWVKILLGLKLKQPESVLDSSTDLTVYTVKGIGNGHQVYHEVEDIQDLSAGWRRYRVLNRSRVLGFFYNPAKYKIESAWFSSRAAVDARFPSD